VTEGDRKAYYESADYTMKQNRQKIAHLQQENKELYKQKADKLKVCYTNYCVITLMMISLHFFTFVFYASVFIILYVKTVQLLL